MKMLETPLYAHVREFCERRAKNATSEIRQGASFTLTATTKKGLEVEYIQTYLPDGDYSERLALRKGSYTQTHENKVRDIDDSMLIGSPEKSLSGYIFRQYKQSPISILSMIQKIVSEYAQKEAPVYFANDFEADFRTMDDAACDHIYVMTDDCLVHIGDRGFFDIVKRASDVNEGLRAAYIAYHDKMRSVNTRNLETALEYMQRGTLVDGNAGDCVALLNKQPHQRLMGRAVFDVDAFQRNQFFIGNLEIRLASHGQYLDSFFEYLLMSNVFDIISKKFGIGKEETMRSIRIAEKSDAVRHREQMKGIADKQSEDPETSLEDKLGLAMREFFDEITSEFNDIVAHIVIYDDFQFWKELRETLGMRFAGRLDQVPEGIEAREWDNDWARRIVDACSGLGQHQPQLRAAGYDMLLHISPERYPTIETSSRNYTRKGIGNMIIDLGDKSLVEQIDFANADTRQALARHYLQNKGKMSGYLFKGKMLRLVLEDIFDKRLPSGGTVAVSTVDGRMSEMVSFCSHKKTDWRFDGKDLRYKGVQIAFLGK